jgi:hypothetical protein
MNLDTLIFADQAWTKFQKCAEEARGAYDLDGK